MPKYDFEIIVNYKPGLLNPESVAIKKAADSLISKDIKLNELIKGKYFRLSITSNDKDTGRSILENLAKDFLSNPVMESYEIRDVSNHN